MANIDPKKPEYTSASQAEKTKNAEVGKKGNGIGVRNKKSTAEGPYQMLAGTWKDMERAAGRTLDRNSPEDNELAMQLYTKKSEKALEQNGLEVNPGNTYALHVYGQKGGVEFLRKIKSDPNGLAIKGMSKQVIDGNKPFFYDKQGRPRTNFDSYNTLSSRVGGPNDPGAVTLVKNTEQQILNDQQQQNIANYQAQQQANIQQEEQLAAAQEQVAEEPIDEQQTQEEVVPEETSALSQASNASGIMYTGNRSRESNNFILPEAKVQEDIRTSGEASKKMRTFANGGEIDPDGGQDERVRLIDKRKIRATTKKAIDPNKDLVTGNYNRKVINRVIDASLKYGVDPNTGLALGLQESGLGNTDENIGHVVGGSYSGQAEEDMIRLFQEKQSLGKKKGRTTDEQLIQMYNGTGKIFPNTEREDHGFAMKKIYGVPVDKSGIDMGKTNLYGVQVKDVRDNVIKKNPQLANIIKARSQNFNSFEGVPYKKGGIGFSYENPFATNENTYNVNPRYFNKKAYGGNLSGSSLTLQNDGILNEFNKGGTHDQNPNGGINQGVSPDGTQNSAEQGETKYNNYVYSDRLKLDKADVDNLYLPSNTVGMTYAEASKYINSFVEENPFDIIVKKTATEQLNSLKIGNDRARNYKEQEEDLVAETDMIKSGQFKYGGIVKRNYAFGGDISDYENYNRLGANQIPTSDAIPIAINSTPGASESQTTGTEVSSGKVIGAASGLAGMAGSAFQKFDTSDMNSTIKKVNTGGAIAKGAASGAATGAMFGPWGAAIGGVIGGALGGIGAGKQNRAAKKLESNKNQYSFNKRYGNMAPEVQNQFAYGGDPNEGFYTKLLKRQTAFNPDMTPFSTDAYQYANNNINANRYQLNPLSSESRIIQESINDETRLNGTSGGTSTTTSKPFQMKGENILRYAGGAGALLNYIDDRKATPRNIQSEMVVKTSSPRYFDESKITNSLNQEMNNRSQIALATSGGSAAAARAMSLAGSNDLNKLKSDAYFKMDEYNNSIRDKDQAETQRISDINTAQRNRDYQENLQEQDYIRGRKELARDNLIKSLQGIGEEQTDRNTIYNLTGGYRTDGTYDPENNQSLVNRIPEWYNKLRGRKENGGLVRTFEMGSVTTSKQKAIEDLKNKYNG